MGWGWMVWENKKDLESQFGGTGVCCLLPALNAANVYLLVKNDVERFDGTSPSKFLKKGRTFILILVKD